MIVNLKPQHSRPTVMLVVGIGLMVFAAWGMTRPDLFERRVLPIVALVAGTLFVLVARALRSLPTGLDALELDAGTLVLHEAGQEVVIGLARITEIHVVEEPLGRGHPLLCLGTGGGGLIEVALLRYGRIEPMSHALREDLEQGTDELPPFPVQAAVRLTSTTMEVAGIPEPFELGSITAVDFVHALSVRGPGLVVHSEPVAKIEPCDMVDAAIIMRRIATGHHVPLPGMTRAAAVTLALHIERARAMMPQ